MVEIDRRIGRGKVDELEMEFFRELLLLFLLEVGVEIIIFFGSIFSGSFFLGLEMGRW